MIVENFNGGSGQFFLKIYLQICEIGKTWVKFCQKTLMVRRSL